MQAVEVALRKEYVLLRWQTWKVLVVVGSVLTALGVWGFYEQVVKEVLADSEVAAARAQLAVALADVNKNILPELRRDRATADSLVGVLGQATSVDTLYSGRLTGNAPPEKSFTTHSRRQLLFLSGSVYAAAPDGQKDNQVGLDIYVDGRRVGQIGAVFHEPGQHFALVPRVLELNLSDGRHTIAVQYAANTDTKTDTSDRLEITLLQLPY